MIPAAKVTTFLLSIFLLTSCSHTLPEKPPAFQNASVHDPSVIKVKDTFYVFGSHLASAKSQDLMNWTQLSTGVHDGNQLMPNVKEELKATFDRAQSDTLGS